MKNPRRSLSVLCLLAILPFCAAAGEKPPIDEEAVTAEMDALIDATGPVDAKQAARAQKLLKKGIKAHDRHDYDKAVEYYRQVLEIDPVNSAAYYEMAYSLSSKGEQAQALDAAVRAIALNPKAENYYILEANILDDLGYSEEALETFRRLLEIKPDSYSGRINLGVTLERMSKFDAAEKEFQAARKIDPERPSAYFHLAQLCRVQGGNYDEQKYLEQFVEHGKQDPRLEQVKARLAQLSKTEIRIDPNHPYMEIELATQLLRTAWRSTTYKQQHPEAAGYRESYEEDREVFDMILSLWREKKEEDPSAAYGKYDLLRRIDDAGFLDEYIWYSRQNAIGEAAKQWLESHPERVEAFLSWARAEGLMGEEKRAEAPETDKRVLPQLRGFPGQVAKALIDSPKSYVINSDSVPKGDYRKKEGRRLARDLKLGTGNRVSCSRTLEQAMENAWAYDVRAVEPAMRCFRPTDRPYQEAMKLLTRMNLETSEISFAPDGSLFEEGKKTHVDVQDSEYLPYYLAKAAWEGEKEFRVAQGGPEKGRRATLKEEFFALVTLAGGYLNSLEPEDGEAGGKVGEGDNAEATREPPQHVPALDRLVAAIQSGDLRGFTLYEVLHKWYGIPLDNLSDENAEALWQYIRSYALVSREREAAR